MNIYESAEDYLERIYMLSEKMEHVRVTDIARSMNYSKPSVSIAMKKLLENKLINISPNSYITLTEKGLEIAISVYDRHRIISSLLIELGVDENIAKDDACKIEHDLSDESFNAIKNYYINVINKK